MPGWMDVPAAEIGGTTGTGYGCAAGNGDGAIGGNRRYGGDGFHGGRYRKG